MGARAVRKQSEMKSEREREREIEMEIECKGEPLTSAALLATYGPQAAAVRSTLTI